VIAPVSGTAEQRLQQVADQITRNTVAISTMHSGVQDGSSAAPGQIGEFVLANLTAATMIAIGNAVARDLTTITLTAGDWDVAGAVYFQATSSAGTDDLRGWINTMPAAQPAGDTGGLAISSTSSGGLVNFVAIPPLRMNLTQSTTVYLSASADYGSGTMQVKGYIRARRMR
jgi:hypothetical protein